MFQNQQEFLLYFNPEAFTMIFTVPLLVLFQALTSVATVAGGDAVFSSEYSEMALALRDPSRVLAIPKRSAAHVLAPDFVSSDSTYWLVEYTYSKASCVSKVVLEVGIATEYCIRTGTASSAKYECTSGILPKLTLPRRK